MQSLQQKPVGAASAVTLTPRECQVVEMLAHGCTYDRAAQRLGISLHTVVTHIKNAYRKLDVHTSGGAVMRAVELGLIGAQRGSL